MRVTIHLECTQCQERNYSSRKSKNNNPERLEMKKYCPRCQGHTTHKETK